MSRSSASNFAFMVSRSPLISERIPASTKLRLRLKLVVTIPTRPKTAAANTPIYTHTCGSVIVSTSSLSRTRPHNSRVASHHHAENLGFGEKAMLANFVEEE